jgi:hypothetical protein
VYIMFGVRCPFLVTSKTTPDPQVMAEFADLYETMIKDVPNCCAPPTKLKAALEACHKHKSIINGIPEMGGPSHGTEDAFFADVGGHLRTQFSKYRDVALDQPKFEALRRKVG